VVAADAPVLADAHVLREVEQQRVRRDHAAGEEVLGGPVTFQQVGVARVGEDVHEQARVGAHPGRDLVQRALAHCAGLAIMPFEWWGQPGSLTTETAKHLIALGPTAAPWPRPRLDAATPLRYLNGEANAMADEFGWIIGDLAADVAAHFLGVAFEARERADARAVRRAEIGDTLDKLHRP
jgi:hypothetical protein